MIHRVTTGLANLIMSNVYKERVLEVESPYCDEWPEMPSDVWILPLAVALRRNSHVRELIIHCTDLTPSSAAVLAGLDLETLDLWDVAYPLSEQAKAFLYDSHIDTIHLFEPKAIIVVSPSLKPRP